MELNGFQWDLIQQSGPLLGKKFTKTVETDRTTSGSLLKRLAELACSSPRILRWKRRSLIQKLGCYMHSARSAQRSEVQSPNTWMCHFHFSESALRGAGRSIFRSELKAFRSFVADSFFGGLPRFGIQGHSNGLFRIPLNWRLFRNYLKFRLWTSSETFQKKVFIVKCHHNCFKIKNGFQKSCIPVSLEIHQGGKLRPQLNRWSRIAQEAIKQISLSNPLETAQKFLSYS